MNNTSLLDFTDGLTHTLTQWPMSGGYAWNYCKASRLRANGTRARNLPVSRVGVQGDMI